MPTSSAMMSLERRAFQMINAKRAANGEPPLVWDAELSRMAQLHSQNMARQSFFGHVGPDGLDMEDRARRRGISGWQILAENVAYNQGFEDPAGFAVERWMRSDKHRGNILNRQFTRSGIGVAQAADGSIFFTQVFISR
ncbi:MAG TPA: CAP domain-containing protein [Pyrinomonadaceae bacterium]